MKTTVAMVALSILLSVVGLGVLGPGQPVATAGVVQDESRERLYANPRLEGRQIDIRLAAHMRPDPVLTAERYCREQGYTRVAYYVMRPSSVTRTMGDEKEHLSETGDLTAFRMIACGHVGTRIAASRQIIGG